MTADVTQNGVSHGELPKSNIRNPTFLLFPPIPPK